MWFFFHPLMVKFVCVLCNVLIIILPLVIHFKFLHKCHGPTNLSLGGTTKNITPEIFETHPTSRQDRTHIKKAFHSKLFVKRLFKSCKIQKSN
jgi:hypothetical protein